MSKIVIKLFLIVPLLSSIHSKSHHDRREVRSKENEDLAEYEGNQKGFEAD